jgi:hypothetical protein
MENGGGEILAIASSTLVFPRRHIIREGRDRYKIYLPKHYNHILETLRNQKVEVDVIIIARRTQ